MLTNKITQSELSFMELWFTPRCFLECFFSNWNNLSEMKENQYGDLRLYQTPLISHESIIDFETTAKKHNLSKKEEFQLRKNVGDSYCFGGRKFGKTIIFQLLDICLDMLHAENKIDDTIFASVDLIHIKAILDKIKRGLTYHPLFKLWKERIAGAPEYSIELKNGYILKSVNFNLGAKNPGNQFFGKHLDRLYVEEASLESEEIYQKRQDSLSEFGAVFRCSGMTNFTRLMPAGRSFYNPENKGKVINLPQYVNPYFEKKDKEERLKELGGESSFSYRIFVKGEVVEDGVSVFDIDRVNECLKKKRKIKRFELKKEDYEYFKDIIVLDRPKNAERIFVNADVGDGAGGTDITIFSEVSNQFNYLYNIILYNMAEPEQYEIFKWIVEKLQANVLAFDCGDALGRGLYARFEKIYNKENLVWYQGQKKIGVGYQKDENGEILIKSGCPVLREEFMSEWAVNRLKTLLYEGKINIPADDFKFINQINSVICTSTGTRKVYACLSETGDHLFDSFKVFSTAEWLLNSFNETPLMNTDWGCGVSSWTKE